MPSISEDFKDENIKQHYHTPDNAVSQSANFKSFNEIGSSSNRVKNPSSYSINEQDQNQFKENYLKNLRVPIPLSTPLNRSQHEGFSSQRSHFNESHYSEALNSDRYRIKPEMQMFQQDEVKKILPYLITKKEFNVKKPQNAEIFTTFKIGNS